MTEKTSSPDAKHNGNEYLTGSEVEQIESDPYLTVDGVIAFRAQHESF